MIALWLLLAHAQEPTAVARWEVVGAHPDDGFVVDLLGAPARRLPWTGGSALQVRCPGDEVPERVGLTRGGVVRIEGDTPSPDGGAWVFPAAPRSVAWTGWLLTPAGCRVERLRSDPGPWTWGWAEWRSRGADLDVEALAGEQAESWAGHDPLRRAALRPPGPHPVGYRRIELGERDPVELGTSTWSRIDGARTLSVQGPLRVRVSVRDLAGRESVCLDVDGESTCATAGPARETLLSGGDLEVRLRTLPDGSRVGRVNHFALALGPGAHTVTVPSDSLARVVTHRAEPWGRPHRLPPGHAVWTPPPGLRWPNLPIVGGRATWLVDPEPGRISGESVRWLPVDALPDDVERVEPDRVTLWLEPESGPCVVTLGEQRFVAHDPRGRVSFAWSGPASVASDLDISVEGCRSWMRAAAGLGPGVRTVGLHTRVRPGETVMALGDRDRPSRVEVAVRRGQDRVVVRAEATSESGAVAGRTWTVVPAELSPPHETADGGEWTEPVRLPLPRGDKWRITVDGDALLRVRQPDLEAERLRMAAAVGAPSAGDPTTPELPPAPESSELPPVSEEQVRAASAAVADASDELDRVAALLARARLLGRLGRLELAGRDLLLAEQLDPEAAGLVDDVLAALRVERERVLFGADRWRALDAAWVRVDPSQTAERSLQRAVWADAADALSVAEATPAPEDLRWWLRAVYGGQILDGAQRLAAYRAAATGRAPDHPALAGLRGLSTWRPLLRVTGASARREVEWGRPPEEGVDLLYPDPWPQRSIVDLASGWALRLGPRSSTWNLPVRCRPLLAEAARQCRFVATDIRGRVVGSVDASSWGRQGMLTVPAGGVAYVRLEGRGVDGAVRWPGGRTPVASRKAWVVGRGMRVGTTLLGPTVLLADVRPRGRGAGSVEVRIGRAAPFSRRVPDDGRIAIPIDADGPVDVSLTFDGGVYADLAQRRPRRGGPTPTLDRRWLRAPEPLTPPARSSEPNSVASTDATDPAVSPRPGLPRGLPADRPAATGIAKLWVDSRIAGPPEPGRAKSGPQVVGALAGVHSRAAPGLWLEAELGAEGGVGDHRVGWVHGGLDRRFGTGRTSTTLLADLDLVGGPFAGSELVAGHAGVGIRALHPITGSWVFEGIGVVDGHVRSSLDPSVSLPTDRFRLWSGYREDHRLGLDLDAALRVRVGPWSSSRLGLGLLSNEPGNGQPVDQLTLDARTDLGRPRLWARLRASLDLRLADADRRTTYLSPLLEARASFAVWPEVSLCIRPWVWGRWRPVQGRTMLLVGVEGRFGPPRALADDRPSRLAERHLGEAGFWSRAAERWPAGPLRDPAAEDGADTPEAATDLPGDAVPEEGGS